MCSKQHIDSVCAGQSCDGACEEGFADCNGNKQKDGCEVSLRDNPKHCGACGVACSSSHVAAVCVEGVCQGECAPGYADCNGDRQKDGCEVATSGDPAHCGGCNVVCPDPPNGKATCVKGTCGGACLPGHEDCNSTMADGCEVDTNSDPANCGGCGQACSPEHVTALACTAGACAGACAAGFADCNGDKLHDGCERPIADDPSNCGGCGVVCPGKVGAGCVSGACNATCDDGLSNQGEGGVDCGGPCPLCPVGAQCKSNADCATGTCLSGKCLPVQCPNGVGLPGPSMLLTQDVPEGIAVGDLDGDGRLDVAVANVSGNSVSLRFGQAHGAFSAGQDIPTGDGAMAVAIGDVDGDGKPDLVVANHYAGTVSVLLNQGGGNFGPKADFNTTPSANDLALGDLDGDGKPDLVVGGRYISVMLNQGGGVFGAPTDYDTSYILHALGVAIGDIDGDGKNDVASTIGVRLNQGAGVLGPSSPYPGVGYADSVSIADMNADGLLDVITTASNEEAKKSDDALFVSLNQGGGVLGKALYSGSGWQVRDAVVADLNGDGSPDIATTSYGTSTVGVFLNDGKGVLAPRVEYFASLGPYGIASGDFDGNGANDLIVSDQTDATLSILLNRGGAVFDTRREFGGTWPPAALAWGDMDGDGLLDLVTANDHLYMGSGNSVTIYKNLGGFKFKSGVSYPTGTTPNTVALGDFDGDGALDVTTANEADNTISVLLNKGDGTLAPQVVHPAGEVPSGVVSGDIDEDGTADIALVNNDGIRVFFNQGGAKFSTMTMETGAFSQAGTRRSLAIGDLNGDGHLDLARLQVEGAWGGNIRTVVRLDNLGNGEFVFGASYEVSNQPTSITVGRLASKGTGSIVVTSEDAGVLVDSTEYPTSNGSIDSTIGDVDSDGLPDLVVAIEGRWLELFLAKPGGSLSLAGRYAPNVSAVQGADVDGDGRMDLAVVGGLAGVSVIPNVCLP